MHRVQELEKAIRYHKALYYQGRPEISDFEYDQLEEELKKIAPESTVLTMVGSLPSGGKKVKHKTKMLSLGKTYKEEDLKSWMGEHECVSMLKIDGVSCSLVYQEGKLFIGKTRGDGSVGEDITSKVRWMETVPSKILTAKNLEVRGELYCDQESFIKLSHEMQGLGLEKPSSQRNIVAGLMGRKDNIELCRYIRFKAFDYITDELKLKKETDKFKALEKDGFDVTDITLHKDHSKVEEVLSEARSFMGEGSYLIDGLVFVYNDLEIHEELGATAHHPRYKMAFKYQGESKQTKIKKIIWGVSRNGILTPVADVEPIELSGAMISRVTLHNFGMVHQNNLKKGDVIEVIRSGEVIPKFISVIKSSTQKFEVPEVCPSCEKEIAQVDIRLICHNPTCPDKVREELLNFIKKIGIDDLSSKRLEEMLKKKLVTRIDDLYSLTLDELLTLDKVKDKLGNKLLSAIERSKNVDLITFLAALGISGGAYNKCEKVVRGGFNSIEKLKVMTVEDLQSVESFAEKSATDFINSFQEKIPLIDRLLQVGFDFEEPDDSIESPVTGKKVCITGSLSEKRSVIEGRLRDSGAVIVGSVTKNTDYLLTNDADSGSSKAKKAKSLDIPIISEEDLKKMLES